MTLVSGAPKPLGRTWTDAEYAVRDAHLAALGVGAFRRMHESIVGTHPCRSISRQADWNGVQRPFW